MSNIAIVYMPVLHRGYVQFFRSLPKSTTLFLVTPKVLLTLSGDFNYLTRKDALRAIGIPEMIRAMLGLQSTQHLTSIRPLTVKRLEALSSQQADIQQLFLSEDDVSAVLQTDWFQQTNVVTSSTFLRWHRDNVAEENAVAAHEVINASELDRRFMKQAREIADQSHDWWRQVGAVLVKEGEVLLSACNQHQPHPQTACTHGDPRSLFSRGVRLDLTTAEHAEAAVLSEAARHGISTDGASLYVSTFPCPACAMLIARAGIKTCYFGGGYAVLDGQSVLESAGVKLVLVK